MLIKIYFNVNDEFIYVTKEESVEIIEALECLDCEYTITEVKDKIYRITWYDYIDEEWNDIWCTKEEFEEQMNLVLETGVKYRVNIYE